MNAEQAYLFSHGVVRDAAYQLQLPGDRARLHGHALTILEQGSTEGAVTVDLARHAMAAREDAEAEQKARLQLKELRYSIAAAAYSALVYDLPQAVAFHRAVYAHPLSDEHQRATASHSGARALLMQGKPGDAIAWIDERETPGDTAMRLELQDARSMALLLLGETKQAQAGAEGALRSLDSSGSALEARLLTTLGAIHTDFGDLEASLLALDRAAKIAAGLGDGALDVQVGNHRARALLTRGRWAEANEIYELVLPAAKGMRDLAIYCNCSVGRGACLLNLGRTDDAEVQLREAESVARQIGNLREAAVALTNLGTVEEWRGNFSRAMDYYWRSLDTHREAGNRKAEAVALRNLAGLESNELNFAEAERLVTEAFRVSRQIGDAAGEGRLYMVVARDYYLQGRIAACLEACRQCLDATGQAGDVFLRAAAHGYLGLALGLMMRHDEALAAAEAAILDLQPPRPVRMLLDFGLLVRLQVLVGVAIESFLVRGDRDEQAWQRAAEALREARPLADQASSPEKCRAYLDSAAGWLQQIREGRWPMSWSGSSIHEVQPAMRAALLDYFRSERPELLAQIASESPELLAAMREGTSDVPDWRNDRIP